MSGALHWIRRFIRDLRRRRVIRVAVVYASAGFVILEAADILQPALRLPSWTVRFIAVLLALGFPLAVGLAWTFDVTEEGLVRTEEEDAAASEVGPGGKPLTSNVIIVGLLIVAIGLLLYPRLFFSGEGASGQSSPATQDTAQVDERSIAVLPFEPLSSGQESKTFARGVHDDLLTRLSNISDLKVISRTSVQKYRDTGLSLPAIADSLGVRWVMEGGVQKAGDQIQVNAQLIDPQTDTHVWADDYRRDLTAEDLFAIQGEITREIADALKAELTAGEQERISGAPTEDLQAYRLYVKGRRQLARRTIGSGDHVEQARRFFTRAIRQDSSFALAWAGLADARAFYPQFTPDSLEAPAVEQKRAARRALRLDPNLAEAHASMGLVYQRTLNAPAALEALQRAIELKPSYWAAHHWLGELLLHIGRPQKALDHLTLALELNPNLALGRHWLFDAYRATGQFKKSLRAARRQQRMGLERELAVMGEIRALSSLGRLEQARTIAEEHVAGLGVETIGGRWLRAYLTQILAAQGDTTGAQEYLDQLRDAGAAPRFLAWAEAGIGNTGRALKQYSRIDGAGWGHIAVLDGLFTLGGLYKGGLQSPSDEQPAIREDPRYRELLREAYQAWGLNPDSSVPQDADVPTLSTDR